MSIKNIVKVWDNNGLIDSNIDFLRTPTKSVYFPITENTENT